MPRTRSQEPQTLAEAVQLINVLDLEIVRYEALKTKFEKLKADLESAQSEVSSYNVNLAKLKSDYDAAVAERNEAISERDGVEEKWQREIEGMKKKLETEIISSAGGSSGSIDAKSNVQLDALNAELARLSELLALNARVAKLEKVPTAEKSTLPPKMLAPVPLFHGKPNEDVDEWLFNLETGFTNSMVTDNLGSRASAYLRDAATTAYRAKTAKGVPDWPTFCKWLRDTYRPHNFYDMTLSKLDVLSQTGGLHE